MGRITFTADDTHERIIEEVKQEGGIDSTSAAVRECIERSAELQQCVADLQNEYEELQQELETERARLESREERINQLEEQLRRRSEVEEKVDVLAKRVEEPDPPFWVKWYRYYRGE